MRCALICSHGAASEAANLALVFGGVIRNNTYVLLLSRTFAGAIIIKALNSTTFAQRSGTRERTLVIRQLDFGSRHALEQAWKWRRGVLTCTICRQSNHCTHL